MSIKKEDIRKEELIHQAYISSELYTFFTDVRRLFLCDVPGFFRIYTSKISRKRK